jgi:hypothetical protein
MATLLQKYNQTKSAMLSQIAENSFPPDQLLVYQELSYRICVLETCQSFCKTAPVTLDTKVMSYHYRVADAYIQCMMTDHKFGQPADKDGKAKRETAAANLNNIVKDSRKRFSSFSPATQDQYKKSISDLMGTVLPAWMQYRNTYINIE